MSQPAAAPVHNIRVGTRSVHKLDPRSGDAACGENRRGLAKATSLTTEPVTCRRPACRPEAERIGVALDAMSTDPEHFAAARAGQPKADGPDGPLCAQGWHTLGSRARDVVSDDYMAQTGEACPSCDAWSRTGHGWISDPDRAHALALMEQVRRMPALLPDHFRVWCLLHLAEIWDLPEVRAEIIDAEHQRALDYAERLAVRAWQAAL